MRSAGKRLTEPVEPLAQRIAERVVDLLVNAVDVNALVARVNLNAVLARVDVDDVLAKVDVNALPSAWPAASLAAQVVTGPRPPELAGASSAGHDDHEKPAWRPASPGTGDTSRSARAGPVQVEQTAAVYPSAAGDAVLPGSRDR